MGTVLSGFHWFLTNFQSNFGIGDLVCWFFFHFEKSLLGFTEFCDWPWGLSSRLVTDQPSRKRHFVLVWCADPFLWSGVISMTLDYIQIKFIVPSRLRRADFVHFNVRVPIWLGFRSFGQLHPLNRRTTKSVAPVDSTDLSLIR